MAKQLSETIGHLMIDLEGQSISDTEKELIQHPMVGGLILFTRNYESPAQIEELIKEVRHVANKELLIAVDHEGGRVQRFREGFTVLPAIAELARQDDAENVAFRHAWLMASELRAIDVDFSFAPVLDINYGMSSVIGDRAFHDKPEKIIQLAKAYIDGMAQAGMASTGKHFPGHGGVVEDSHTEMPIDKRLKEELFNQDIKPFSELMRSGLNAVMPAHVIYENVDKEPAGFSTYWLQTILREQLGFNGVIFTDDLSMQGAAVKGGYIERAEAAQAAGCDMLLACNNQEGAISILDHANLKMIDESSKRLMTMRGKNQYNREALLNSKDWSHAIETIETIC